MFIETIRKSQVFAVLCYLWMVMVSNPHEQKKSTLYSTLLLQLFQFVALRPQASMYFTWILCGQQLQNCKIEGKFYIFKRKGLGRKVKAGLDNKTIQQMPNYKSIVFF